MRAFIILSVLELIFWAFFILLLIRSYAEIHSSGKDSIEPIVWVSPAIAFFLASLVGLAIQLI